MTTRKTLKDFFINNPSSPSAPGVDLSGVDRISFSHKKSGEIVEGQIDRESIKEGDDIQSFTTVGGVEVPLLDLPNEANGILGEYVSFITKEADNIFAISPGNEEAAPTKRGESLVLAEEQGSENVFVVTGDQLSDSLTQYSNGQFSNLDSIVNKTGNPAVPGQSGHDLLSGVTGTGLAQHGAVHEHTSGDGSFLSNKINSDILSNSRFGNIPNKRAFKHEDENDSFHESESKLHATSRYGKYEYLDEENKVRLDQLKELGASLLYKASGFDPFIAPGASFDTEAQEAAIKISKSKLTNNVDGEPQIGSASTRARNAAGFPTSEGVLTSIRDGKGQFFGDDRKSYGAPYNTQMHFSGKNLNRMKMQAALSIESLIILSEVVYSDILSTLVSSPASLAILGAVEEDFTSANTGQSILGKSRGLYNLKLDYLKMIALTPTIYPYKQCVNRGLRVLFKSDDTASADLNSRVTVDVSGVSADPSFSKSPGFWYAIARSAMNSFRSTLDALDTLSQSESDEENFQYFIHELSKNNIVRFMNAIATVGDASLQAYSGLDMSPENLRIRSRNVDNLPDGPGTRVGKSRKDQGRRTNQLAWSQNDVPSAYILPINQLRAAGRLDQIMQGPNPFTAMMGSELVDNTYTGITMDGSSARIPKDVVKALENRLEAEYVPFYIQDLRTNEIISFHAFLSQLTDSISPNYNRSSGYGRLDPVQIYESTTRSLNVGFTLVATSREDFNTMWYKINKLVTLLYPQWTRGTLVGHKVSTQTKDESVFIQPHTQVLGATPLARIRIGDIIKSNYSKFNLAKIFGIGDSDVRPLAKDTFSLMSIPWMRQTGQAILNIVKDVATYALTAVYGSPMDIFNTGMAKNISSVNILTSKAADGLASTATNFLKNGFVNPLALKAVDPLLTDPNTDLSNALGDFGSGNFVTSVQNVGRISAPSEGSKPSAGHGTGTLANFPMYLKGNNNQGYKIVGGNKTLEGKRIFIPKPIKVFIKNQERVSMSVTAAQKSSGIKHQFAEGSSSDRILYRVEIRDYSLPVDTEGIELLVEHTDLYQIPNETLMSTLGFGILLAGTAGFVSTGTDAAFTMAKGFMNRTGIAPVTDFARLFFASEESQFMDGFNNPFVKAYESTAGRGLAGVMGGITFNWLEDFAWEIDHGSRAPIGCNISFQFDVIHDIQPGLDHAGYNRAPIYNVGDIMQGISGDVYESFNKENEFEFRKQSGKGIKIQGVNSTFKKDK